MNKSIIYYACICIGMLLCMPSCSDDDEPVQENPSPSVPAPYSPLPEYVSASNQVNLGMGAADSANIYYWTATTPTKVALCAQNKENGKVTVLDSIESPGSGRDFMFTSLHAKNGYLYYQPFDVINDRRYVICAVKTDGTQESQVIAQNVFTISYTNDAIYYIDASTLEEIYKIEYTPDGTSSEPQLMFFNDGISKLFCYNGFFYYEKYVGSGSDFHAIQCKASIDGNVEQIYEFDTYGRSYPGKDNLLIFDTDPQGANAGTYVLNSVPYTGGSYQTLLTGLTGNTAIAEYEGTLFIGIYDSSRNEKWENGLYSMNLATGEIKNIIAGTPISYINIISDTQLIVGNSNELVSRMACPYIVDFDGSNMHKLTN